MGREWTEAAECQMAGVTGRALWVEDATAGHYRLLDDGEAVADALACYAAGYDCDPQTITVRWALYRNGRRENWGTHTFEAPARPAQAAPP